METIRRIATVNMRGVTPALVSSSNPKFDWVDPGSLFVEESYQRGLTERSLTLIRKIVANWNWAHIKPPVCVHDNKGRLVVIDGQHTAIAALSHGRIPKIPVMIVEAKTLKDRATAFVSQNRDRLVLTPMQIHHAAVAAGEETAMAVAEACERSGASILKQGRGIGGLYKIGETFSVGIITSIVKKKGVNAGVRVLKTMVAAKRAPLPANEIAAVAILLFEKEYRDTFEVFDLVTVIRSKSVEEWKAQAARHRASKGTTNRVALAEVWKRAVDRG